MSVRIEQMSQFQIMLRNTITYSPLLLRIERTAVNYSSFTCIVVPQQIAILCYHIYLKPCYLHSN